MINMSDLGEILIIHSLNEMWILSNIWMDFIMNSTILELIDIFMPSIK